MTEPLGRAGDIPTPATGPTEQIDTDADAPEALPEHDHAQTLAERPRIFISGGLEVAALQARLGSYETQEPADEYAHGLETDPHAVEPPRVQPGAAQTAEQTQQAVDEVKLFKGDAERLQREGKPLAALAELRQTFDIAKRANLPAAVTEGLSAARTDALYAFGLQLDQATSAGMPADDIAAVFGPKIIAEAGEDGLAELVRYLEGPLEGAFGDLLVQAPLPPARSELHEKIVDDIQNGRDLGPLDGQTYRNELKTGVARQELAEWDRIDPGDAPEVKHTDNEVGEALRAAAWDETLTDTERARAIELLSTPSPSEGDLATLTAFANLGDGAVRAAALAGLQRAAAAEIPGALEAVIEQAVPLFTEIGIILPDDSALKQLAQDPKRVASLVASGVDGEALLRFLETKGIEYPVSQGPLSSVSPAEVQQIYQEKLGLAMASSTGGESLRRLQDLTIAREAASRPGYKGDPTGEEIDHAISSVLAHPGMQKGLRDIQRAALLEAHGLSKAGKEDWNQDGTFDWKDVQAQLHGSDEAVADLAKAQLDYLVDDNGEIAEDFNRRLSLLSPEQRDAVKTQELERLYNLDPELGKNAAEVFAAQEIVENSVAILREAHPEKVQEAFNGALTAAGVPAQQAALLATRVAEAGLSPKVLNWLESQLPPGLGNAVLSAATLMVLGGRIEQLPDDWASMEGGAFVAATIKDVGLLGISAKKAANAATGIATSDALKGLGAGVRFLGAALDANAARKAWESGDTEGAIYKGTSAAAGVWGAAGALLGLGPVGLAMAAFVGFGALAADAATDKSRKEGQALERVRQYKLEHPADFD